MLRLGLTRRWIGLLVFGAVLCASASMGCGAKKATVTGKVSYKGETLGSGNVVFIGSDDKAVSSMISPDGSYRISNVPTGTVKITVETIPMPDEATQKKNMMGVDMPGMKGDKTAEAGKYVRIPAQYKDPTKSGLTYQVKSGAQKYDIKLD